MRHRVFIAINLPENIKKGLVSYQTKWPDLPIRWTKKDNLHITLEFLGYLSDDELLKVCQNTEELTAKRKSFSITLDKICYGPPEKMPPRMIWVMGGEYHVTLGRIKIWQWRQIEPEERPEVNEEINLTFEVNSIEVMESVLSRDGPKYTILESYPLND